TSGNETSGDESADISESSFSEESEPASPMQYRLHAVNVGDVVAFGSYEQDNDTLTPGSTEDMEWIVIAEEDSRALLLSRYIIDCIPFDSENMSVSWEDSYMRQWLNGTFYESVFDDTERLAIIATELETQIPGYSNTVSTTDNVFLLSGADLGRYFEFDYWDETYHLGECAPALITSATEFALANGCYNTALNSKSAAETVAAHPELDGQMSEMWWVRETGCIVGLTGDTIGSIHWQPGEPMIPITRSANVAMGVRPAIWVAVEN
ncbi:MAG: DUF6273 domain-containing protein, partial [Lachnospiraceae bacterium]|nr:DUF6273 domain-containing protein [Lachnospiraceae bacterium]